MHKRVAVLGLGLIGGSIALGLRERTDVTVLGFDVMKDRIEFARKTGVIHEGSTELATVVEQADIIVLSAPVGVIKQLIDQLVQLPLKPGCIVTDVGSTKSEIVQAGEKLFAHQVTFIGGHPMAGSHKSGIRAADSLLFENAYYILTPSQQASPALVETLSELLAKATKAQLITMDAEIHDQIVGAISHLPHIIAAGLVVQVGEYNKQNDWFHRLAAGGFRDLTRIASSHPVMWRDVLLSNREEVLSLLEDWVGQMEKIKTAVADQDAQQIEDLFTEAKQLRAQLPDQRKGILTQIYECYVSVPDHPGVIGKIATLLGDRNVNLSNIGIMENREDFPGVLRLSFREQTDYKRAIAILEKVGYQVFADVDHKSPQPTQSL